VATVGLVGGLGPESTIDYYRRLLQAWERVDPSSAPSIVIDSLDVRRGLHLVEHVHVDGELIGQSRLLLVERPEVAGLARGGGPVLRRLIVLRRLVFLRSLVPGIVVRALAGFGLVPFRVVPFRVVVRRNHKVSSYACQALSSAPRSGPSSSRNASGPPSPLASRAA